jgi:hypothetical protein
VGNVPPVSCFNPVCSTRNQAKRSQSPPIGEIIRGFSPNRSMVSPPRYPFVAAGINQANNNRWKCRSVNRREKHSRNVTDSPKRKGCSSSSTTTTSCSSSSTGRDYRGYERDGSISPERYGLNLSEQKGSSRSSSSSSSLAEEEQSGKDQTSEEADEEDKPKKSRTRQVPTLSEKIDFLKSLDTAATKVFHRKTGLPLTSSPAPLRKGQDRFDFDSTLVSATRITSRFRRGCHPPRYFTSSQREDFLKFPDEKKDQIVI